MRRQGERERESQVGGGGLAGNATTRGLFGELLEEALCEVGARPSRMAVAYLLELLDAAVTRPERAAPPSPAEPSLAEALLLARLERDAVRISRLRALGDRALFVAGVFGERLGRSLVGVDYYGQIGRAAYADLSRSLPGTREGRDWAALFRELAEDFLGLADVLAGVGDRTRAQRDVDLLRTYDRYLATGSERDRRRLARAGVTASLDPGRPRRWQ